MPNMSHCRFTNTLDDLRECYDHWDDDLGAGEAEARERLLIVCQRVVDNYADEGC